MEGYPRMVQGSVAQSTDQLVAIAVLASASHGDFLTVFHCLYFLIWSGFLRTELFLVQRSDPLTLGSCNARSLRIDGEEISARTMDELSKGDVILVRPGIALGSMER